MYSKIINAEKSGHLVILNAADSKSAQAKNTPKMKYWESFGTKNGQKSDEVWLTLSYQNTPSLLEEESGEWGGGSTRPPDERVLFITSFLLNCFFLAYIAHFLAFYLHRFNSAKHP